MHPWIEHVYQCVQKHRLIEDGDTVLVALSGGADSVALLYAMCQLKETLHLKDVQAMHLHHGLRGAFADRDEAFVHTLCHSWNVPLSVSKADVAREAAEHKETVEEAGRRLRYAFFESVADSIKGPVKIAVAHNADDQAETVLFHLIRGTGITGLRGIPVRRGRVIRPLLDSTSASIRAFCADNQLSYMLDETNESLAYARNRIRHCVLPQMQQINSAVSSNICRLSHIAREEDAFLEQLATETVSDATGSAGFDLSVLQQAPDVICKRALKQIVFDQCGQHADHAQIELLYHTILNGGRFGGLPRRLVAVCEHDLLCFIGETATPRSDLCITLPLNVPTSFADGTICARQLTYDEFLEKSKIHKNFLYFCVSYDMICGDIQVRSRQSGDRIHAADRHGGKSLKKLFNEQKIPLNRRSSIPVIADHNGIIAVLGYAIDERVAVRESTQSVLFFECSQNIMNFLTKDGEEYVDA